jgi:hypothetical protein
MIGASTLASELGVTRQAVYDAIRRGRLRAYDPAGRPLLPGAKGARRFVDREEALAAWNQQRQRVDDPALASLPTTIVEPFGEAAPAHGSIGWPAPPTLVSAKTDKERLHAALLRIRLQKEQREVIPREAVQAEFTALGSEFRKLLESLPGAWAEPLLGIMRSGIDAPALAAWLRVEVQKLITAAADRLQAGQAMLLEGGAADDDNA